MGAHPFRCWADLACMAGVTASVLGWLPAVLASIASLVATTYYAILVYDRLRHKKEMPHV